ncbi:hypothetical protein M758_3G185700 [Ceratodon purpureus]|uniref:Uncharacterized protein n=1 Tax=Ceratodon purpureus TaxID=3225 RepID=A0A8T0IK16_CERPU|nr:hypothetical protein KC19_3G186700 [Ceratodon purpureus]KAG0623589.1 hypothetical protein M758_3G185700 [Ceratodon purpureus]
MTSCCKFPAYCLPLRSQTKQSDCASSVCMFKGTGKSVGCSELASGVALDS